MYDVKIESRLTLLLQVQKYCFSMNWWKKIQEIVALNYFLLILLATYQFFFYLWHVKHYCLIILIHIILWQTNEVWNAISITCAVSYSQRLWLSLTQQTQMMKTLRHCLHPYLWYTTIMCAACRMWSQDLLQDCSLRALSQTSISRHPRL